MFRPMKSGVAPNGLKKFTGVARRGPHRAALARGGKRAKVVIKNSRENSDCIIIPAKARDYVFTGVGLFVCLFVCWLPR